MDIRFSHSTFVKIAPLLAALAFSSCQKTTSKNESATQPATQDVPFSGLFKKLDPTQTGITFANGAKDDNSLNAINFSYLYIGGGVAIGDINNDGLQDVYFTSTQYGNKLYLNKGNLKFEDITQTAGVAGEGGLKMGVTMADVNGDGFLDIYVCRSGQSPEGRTNFLFLNNKNLTFTESAVAAGLDDKCSSNHANFFDYDLDGDLDLYLLNHPEDFNTITKMRVETVNGKYSRITSPMNPYESDRLYRNNGNGTFTDVSKQAGIVNRAFGLSCTVHDVNHDGYPDIYIGNDYIEPDILYINNRNGTFTDKIDQYFRHTSHFTMGADFSDVNNDGLMDFISMDMLPEDNERQKLLATAMVNDRFNTLLKYGYGHQFMRNMLQINNGRDFTDLGVLSGISATDWSWGPVMMDFDNDGWKDIFIANGIFRDFTNNDYIHFTLDSVMRAGGEISGDINQLLKTIPSVKIRNYMYRNRGDLTFQDVSNAWGFSEKTFSNASAYADLDNDGDLDLVINNLAEPAGIYENQANGMTGNHWLQVVFEGKAPNSFAIGSAARITYDGGKIQYQELTPTRGFFTSQQMLVHFGLGKISTVDKLEIRWPDGKIQTLQNLKADQKITVKYSDAVKGAWAERPKPAPIFQEKQSTASGIDFQHVENLFVDYNREFLMPHNLSALGPCLATGDADGDGLEDFFVGGATGQAGVLYRQTVAGKFEKTPNPVFETDKNFEDMGCALFDADGDKDLDLFVVSGGNVETYGAETYESRLYRNDGKGVFTRDKTAVPKTMESASCLAVEDYDKDGDLDIFIGGRVVANGYPNAPTSYVLQNNAGKFTDVTTQVAPDFQRCGMVCAIQFADLDRDGSREMVVTGEWMPISIFKFKNGRYSNETAAFRLEKTRGWWNTVAIEDLDRDGDPDLVCGNLGLNSRLRASEREPLQIFAKDFDNNGSVDPIIAVYNGGKAWPLPQRDLIVKQMPVLKKKFLHYSTYAKATIDDLFPKKDLESAKRLVAETLATTVFLNEGNGKFTARQLPNEAQVAPVNKILVGDYTRDGHPDLLMVGNDYGSEVETGRYDAFSGLLLAGDGKGNFSAVKNMDSGFWATKNAKDLAALKLKNGKTLFLVANNNDRMQAFEF